MSDPDTHIDLIADKLTHTAIWRRNLAETYADPRNVTAAVQLDAIAEDRSVIDDDTIAALAPYFNTHTLHVVTSECARDVGFRCRVKGMQEFLALAVARLAAKGEK